MFYDDHTNKIKRNYPPELRRYRINVHFCFLSDDLELLSNYLKVLSNHLVLNGLLSLYFNDSLLIVYSEHSSKGILIVLSLGFLHDESLWVMIMNSCFVQPLV